VSILIQTYIDQTTQEVLLPHYENLKQSNPDQDIHIISGDSSSSTRDKQHKWKNSDQQLRGWWKQNKSLVRDDIVYVIEHDTLITQQVPELPHEFDLVGKSLYIENTSMRHRRKPLRSRDKNWTPDNWMWWHESNYMLEELGDKPAYGLVSFGFYVMRRWVLDCIMDEKYNTIYGKDIISELRFPTIASLCGARLGEIPLPNVQHYNVPYPRDNKPGIYHGVLIMPKRTQQEIEEDKKAKHKMNQGVGTELSKILESYGFKITANCKCKQRALLMNNNGVEWCENNIDTIIGWLKEEADKRNLGFIFSELIAKRIIKRAIRAAKKDTGNEPTR